MKELNAFGSKLCTYQALIFEKSLISMPCSSKIFLRRFFYSDFTRKLDESEEYEINFEVDQCYDSLNEQYSETEYGSKKISADVLYWLGYLSRYICFTREITSKKLYKTIPLDQLIDHYEIYHTQSEEWVIREVLASLNLNEDIFDKDVQTKLILTRLWSSVL